MKRTTDAQAALSHPGSGHDASSSKAHTNGGEGHFLHPAWGTKCILQGPNMDGRIAFMRLRRR